MTRARRAHGGRRACRYMIFRVWGESARPGLVRIIPALSSDVATAAEERGGRGHCREGCWSCEDIVNSRRSSPPIRRLVRKATERRPRVISWARLASSHLHFYWESCPRNMGQLKPICDFPHRFGRPDCRYGSASFG